MAGLRRLTACKVLGWTEIECNIIEIYDIDIELAEIDENLIREDLTALQRAEQLQRRKWIFGQKGGHKIPTLGGEQEIGFAKDASASTGAAKRSINQFIAIADGIPIKLRDKLRRTAHRPARPLAQGGADAGDLCNLIRDGFRGRVPGL